MVNILSGQPGSERGAEDNNNALLFSFYFHFFTFYEFPTIVQLKKPISLLYNPPIVQTLGNVLRSYQDPIYIPSWRYNQTNPLTICSRFGWNGNGWRWSLQWHLRHFAYKQGSSCLFSWKESGGFMIPSQPYHYTNPERGTLHRMINTQSHWTC